MKERPILFSGAMVRALLAGTKTQTRRLVMPIGGRQKRWLTREGIDASPKLTIARCDEGDANVGDLGAGMEHPKGGPLGWVRCPYGEPGDRLWVKETIGRVDITPGPSIAAEYMADRTWVPGVDAWPWQRGILPSIHMPKGMRRLILEVTGIRVERLHDISEEDARAEGVEVPIAGTGRARFALLWDAINGKRAPWSSNPWLWVVSFKRVEAAS